jgi:uncharacterized protein (TIGR03086 family)
MTILSDPRPLFRRAHAWVHSLLDGVHPKQLEAPTPCPELDVRVLAGHLVATVRKLTAMGQGGDRFSVPSVITGIPDGGFAAAYAEAARELWTVWDDDAILTATLDAPWGDVPGAETMWGFLNETLVHGWDLARATGQNTEAEPDLVTPVLAIVEQLIPAEPRGNQFAPAVEPAQGAGPTERLANWSGRKAGAR